MNDRLTHGRLYYLAGPSGAGKDTLLRALAARRPAIARLRIARRYITRPPARGGERNVELGVAEFERRRADGEFLFAWQSHGYRYAIGREILGWLQAGDDVVVNGSRHYLDRARRIYPALIPLWLTASEPVLRARLSARGRETAAEIDGRLARSRELETLRGGDVACIENDGSNEAAVAEFLRLRAERG